MACKLSPSARLTDSTRTLKVFLIIASAMACDDRSAPKPAATDVGSGQDPQRLLVLGNGEEGSGHTLYQVTGALRAGAGTIVVANGGGREILFFNDSGGLAARAGGPGAGPGEFQSLTAILPFKEDSLLAWDPLLRRFSIYSLEGEFGRVVRTDAFVGQLEARLSGDDFVVTAPRRLRPESSMTPWTTYVDSIEISILDSWLDSQRPVGTFGDLQMVLADASPLGPARLAVPVPEAPRTLVTGFHNTVFVGRTDRKEIRVLDKTGRQRGTMALPLPDPRLRGSAAKEASIRSALQRADRRQRPLMRRYLEQFPQPDEYPLFDQLVPDMLGRLWVRHYTVPPDTLARWTVVDTAGVHVRDVALPSRFRPTQIGSDWILGILLDKDDVEFVSLLPLPPELR